MCALAVSKAQGWNCMCFLDLWQFARTTRKEDFVNTSGGQHLGTAKFNAAL